MGVRGVLEKGRHSSGGNCPIDLTQRDEAELLELDRRRDARLVQRKVTRGFVGLASNPARGYSGRRRLPQRPLLATASKRLA